jgi:hypothetical protein
VVADIVFAVNPFVKFVAPFTVPPVKVLPPVPPLNVKTPLDSDIVILLPLKLLRYKLPPVIPEMTEVPLPTVVAL